jgi:hypothetical protein
MNRWRVRLAELQRDCIAEPGNVRNVQIVQKSASIPAFEHFEQFEQQPEAAQRQPRWRDEEEERAAIIEFDGGVPHAWATVLDRLDPAKPPVDVPPQRWLRFIDDCSRFLDQGWASRATILGWGSLDLFGCDRERPFVRVDHKGLLWLLNGGRVVQMHRDRASIETQSGARQTYRRRPVEVGRVVLAWELTR